MSDIERAKALTGHITQAQSQLARLSATRAGDARLATLRDLLMKASQEAKFLESEVSEH